MAGEHQDDPKTLHPIGARLLWIEKDANIVRMITILAVVCAALFVADYFAGRYPYFALEGTYGFYAVYGFIAFSFIVITTKYLKRVIGRAEDYYAPNAVDSEPYPLNGLDVRDREDG